MAYNTCLVQITIPSSNTIPYSKLHTHKVYISGADPGVVGKGSLLFFFFLGFLKAIAVGKTVCGANSICYKLH